MNERKNLLESIANTIADYREGEIPKPSGDHVDRWIERFNPEFQLPILREIDYILKKTYFSRERVIYFLESVIQCNELVGSDPCSFWKNVNFLNNQGGGDSQCEMLEMFDDLLQNHCGLGVAQFDSENKSIFVYLDDAIFTGNRVIQDLDRWIPTAPEGAVLHIISIAIHSGGHYYADKTIKEKIKEIKKNITIKWWYEIKLEDRKNHTHISDVLRPRSIPNTPNVLNYVDKMTYKPVLRNNENIGDQNLFTDNQAKDLIEQQFLIAGVHIRHLCPLLPATHRPLGYHKLEMLGFGSTIVTFRNCPNTTPLAFWAGDPWYPLFPRKTNNQTATERILSNLPRGGS
jgi:hypothetical protein